MPTLNNKAPLNQMVIEAPFQVPVRCKGIDCLIAAKEAYEITGQIFS